MNIIQSLKIKTFSIKLQLILMIALGIFLPILLLIVFSGIKFKTLAETAAKNKSFAAAQQYSNKIQGNLNSLFSSVNNLAITYESLIKLKKSSWLSVNEIHEISEKFLSSNPTVVSVYTILSPGRIDSSKTNRNSNLIFLGNDNIDGKITEYDNWDYQFKSSVEDTLEKGKGFMLLPPYVDNTIGSKPMLIISYGKRLDIDNRFSGLVGIDISINWIQEFISGIDLFNKKAHITIVSNTGIINGDNKDNSLIGKNIREALKSFTIESKHLMSGSESELKYNGNYIFYVPIKFDNLGEPWHIRILVPEQEILNDANKELYIRILYFVIVTFLILFVSYFYFNRLSGRISTLAASAKLVAKGNLSVEIKSVGNDELTALGDSLQSIVTRFSNILNGIKNSLDQLKISTEELSKTSDTLHEGASGQASSTEQVSAA
ncbi:MAG: methyl-accepting chemotaxis protein, partial [Bacteroidales bacterium]